MEWAQLLSVAAWNMVCGIAIGYSFASRNTRRPVLDGLFERARQQIISFERFAATPSCSKGLVRDENGNDWIITVERAGS